MFGKRILVLALTPAAMATVALATAGAASAAPAPLMDVATHYSQYLAGHGGEGNGGAEYTDVRMQLTAPAESICTDVVGEYPRATCGNGTGVVPGELAIGGLLAENVSVGGWEDAVALVFDTDACPGQWTVESGFGFYDFVGPVLPVNDLHPDMYFGNPICVAPGASEWIEAWQTGLRGRTIEFFAGPTRSDENATQIIHVPFRLHFQTFAFGVNTSNGNVAANLNTGTLATFSITGLTQRFPSANRTLSQVNFDSFIGTMTGAAPSVANPQTLTPTEPSGGAFEVLVP